MVQRASERFERVAGRDVFQALLRDKLIGDDPASLRLENRRANVAAPSRNVLKKGARSSVG